MEVATPTVQQRRRAVRKPRLGFVGVGWIGRHRMEAMVETGAVEVAAIADPSRETAEEAGAVAPEADLYDDLAPLLEADLDGVVIATPSALHAEQAVAALEAGLAVFCQKPLGRTAAETRAVVEAARRADRLLGVDLSYRHVRGLQAVRERVRNGDVGRVYAVDLVFHNAYGPAKAWASDPALAGGGCVIDLGIHLVDMALWTLGFPEVDRVSGQLFAQGTPVTDPAAQVEDYAVAQIELADGTAVRVACSWHHAIGQDAVIEATFHGSEGSLALHNVDGSFYDFVAEAYWGASAETLVAPPDAWGGRAAAAWAERLADRPGYDPAVERVVEVAAVLDRIYGRAPATSAARS